MNMGLDMRGWFSKSPKLDCDSSFDIILVIVDLYFTQFHKISL